MGNGGMYSRVGLGLVLLALSAHVWADGGFVARRDMWEPEQKAAILFDRGVEDLIIQVQFEGEVEDFAWLVPLPTKPDVSVVEEKLFDELRKYVFERSKWWTYSPRQGSRGAGGGLGGGAVKHEGVTVHEHKRVGVYDVAILSADTVDDLVRWCKQHAYPVSDEARAVLKSYVDRGWVFTAMRIHPEARGRSKLRALRRGTIQPMRFTFPTDEAIYPLKISSINRGATDVLLYILADDTLIHPAFEQRHPPSFDEFHRHRLDVAVHGSAEKEEEFSKYFDATRATYRPISVEELPAARKALPRWGDTPLYLTALQRTFEPEEMDYDVVFKPPEGLSFDEQKDFAQRSLGKGYSLPAALFLRMPEAASDAIYAQPEQEYGDVEYQRWDRAGRLGILLSLENVDAVAALAKAGPQPDFKSRAYLVYVLSRALFVRDHSCRPYDQITEDDWCQSEHERFDVRPGESWSCHYRLGVPPTGPAYAIEDKIAELFLNDAVVELAAKMLSALGTDDAVALLTRAALGELDETPSEQLQGAAWDRVALPGSGGHPSDRETSRREAALSALRQVKRPEMTAVYAHVFATQQASLNDRELAYCLSGLWANGGPEVVPLIRRIEAHCREANLPQATLMAQNLLVNRFRVRQPQVTEGMRLDALQEEMGGKGEFLLRRNAAGKDLTIPRSFYSSFFQGDSTWYPGGRSRRRRRGIRKQREAARVEVEKYRWDAGEATLKRGVLVEWKPNHS